MCVMQVVIVHVMVPEEEDNDKALPEKSNDNPTIDLMALEFSKLSF